MGKQTHPLSQLKVGPIADDVRDETRNAQLDKTPLLRLSQNFGTWKLATARGFPYMEAAQDQA